MVVSTAREPGGHRITVRDNGVGFDPKRRDSDGKSHIGLQNVKDRVEQMCGGTMLLESEKGKGACVTLLIPDGNKGEKEGNRR